MIDTTPLGQLTAKLMDVIDHYEQPYEIRTAAIVVEVDSPDAGHVLAMCTDDRPWVLSAFLGEALDGIDARRDNERQPRSADQDDYEDE